VKRMLIAASLIAVVTIGVAAGVVLFSAGEPEFQTISDSAPADYEYVIPKGTGERVDAGEEISIIPSELDVYVGESIRIVNNDARGHIVGVFFVGSGETMSQEFTSAGTLSGGCTIHPSGKFTLQVLE
jgi:plastocyanin